MTRQLQMWLPARDTTQPGQPPGLWLLLLQPRWDLGGAGELGGQRPRCFPPHTRKEALKSSEAQDLIHFWKTDLSLFKSM